MRRAMLLTIAAVALFSARCGDVPDGAVERARWRSTGENQLLGTWQVDRRDTDPRPVVGDYNEADHERPVFIFQRNETLVIHTKRTRNGTVIQELYRYSYPEPDTLRLDGTTGSHAFRFEET